MRRLSLFAGLLFFAACSSAEPSAPPSAPPAAVTPDAGAAPPAPLGWGPCDTTDWPEGYPTPARGVECTTITVPFDHAHPEDGRTVDLRVARHLARTPTGRAVFQLAGGPGGTAVGQSGLIPRYFPRLLDGFDLVYVDRRGTGGSRYLGCKGGYPEAKSEWIACAHEHAADDLARYLTVDAAHDIEHVRVALGYGKIHLRGGSYGTRLGLEVLRQHPSSVAAAVLDGMAPPDSTFFEDFIGAADRGVENLARACGASAACKAITPDVAADLSRHREAVKKSPRPILVDGRRSVEDEETFLGVLEGALFEASTFHRIPRAIHGAASGDFEGWDQLMSTLFGQSITEPTQGERPPGDDGSALESRRQIVAPLSSSSGRARLRALRLRRRPSHGTSYVAPGLYMTVVCTEDLPNSGSLAELRAHHAAQKWGGNARMIGLAEACGALAVPPLDAALRAPVRSDARVLLVNGELDLNTLPEWGAHAAATLPNATNLVVPHATHSTMLDPCAARIMADYLAVDGDAARVDMSCLKSMPDPAF